MQQRRSARSPRRCHRPKLPSRSGRPLIAHALLYNVLHAVHAYEGREHPQAAASNSMRGAFVCPQRRLASVVVRVSWRNSLRQLDRPLRRIDAAWTARRRAKASVAARPSARSSLQHGRPKSHDMRAMHARSSPGRPAAPQMRALPIQCLCVEPCATWLTVLDCSKACQLEAWRGGHRPICDALVCSHRRLRRHDEAIADRVKAFHDWRGRNIIVLGGVPALELAQRGLDIRCIRTAQASAD